MLDNLSIVVHANLKQEFKAQRFFTVKTEEKSFIFFVIQK